jgi:HIRAN domain
MGLFRRMFSSAVSPAVDDSVSLDIEAEVIRDEMVNVVGESNYQPAIRKACGWKPGTDTHFECFAELVPEPTNLHDPNAVRVDINGTCVGYLSRADAVELGPAIREALSEHGSGLVRAVIAGHAVGDTDNLGVFLHLRLGREIVSDDDG